MPRIAVALSALFLLGATPPLPLKAITLYETGLGYYERKGTIPAGSVVEIPLESGQLDDALKTLVIVSERGVASVEYDPPLAPEAARALAGVPEPDGQRSLEGLTAALRGAVVRIEQNTGKPLEGRIVEVVEQEEH